MAGTIVTTQPNAMFEATSPNAAVEAAAESRETKSTEVSADVLSRSTKTALLIAGLLAFSATAVSMMLLGGILGVLGSFVAFSLMLFIGTPLMLASINDAVEGH